MWGNIKGIAWPSCSIIYRHFWRFFHKATIYQYILGDRGDGDFPSPILKVEDKSPLWLWSKVAHWLYKKNKGISGTEYKVALSIETFNAALNVLDEAQFKREKILREKILMQKAA